jgi:hypothetical protein
MYNTDTGELVTSHIVLKQTYFVAKLPATRGASKPGLTESASTFGFYLIHRAIHLFVALRDNYIRRCFVNIFTAKRITAWALNTSLSTSRLPLLPFFFGFSSV